MQGRKPIRIMLLDDHPIILLGLEVCLSREPDFDVIGRFGKSSLLITALHDQEVDIVLLDFSLAPDDVDGLSLLRGLKVRFPHVRLLVVSAVHDFASVTMILRCGADGFIGKEVEPQQLITAVRRVVAGKKYLSKGMSNLLYTQAVSSHEQHDDVEYEGLGFSQVSSNLTCRELEVLRCYLEGMSVTEIADKFSRSIKTISAQKQAALKKLGLRNANELFKMRYYLER
ncbi:response regulator [Pseudomonas sp. MDT1-17]